MSKDFWSWHKIKKEIDEWPPISFYYEEREVWWCWLGANIGHEQDGKGNEFKRPVVVFKKFNPETFWAIPLTTRQKTGPFYLSITLGDGIERKANISQLRLIDSRRLSSRIGLISESEQHLLAHAISKICNSTKTSAPAL